MKRLALLLMLLASPAWAAPTHKYVTTTGAGGHTGDDLANAYSLAEANSAAAPTFVFHLSDGTYATGIAPAASGDSLTDEACVYIGNTTTPSAVTVGSITLDGDNFVTIRSLASNGVVSVTNGYRDSLHDVSGTGSGVGSTTASLVTDHLIRSYINGGTWTRGTGTRHWTASGLTYCYFTGMTITHSYSGTGIGETRAWLMDGALVDSCYFVGIKQTVTVPSNASFVNEPAWRFFYEVRNTYFIDCKLTANNSGTAAFGMGLRGTTALHHDVHYVRDTILSTGSSTERVAVSGNQAINDLFFTDCVYILGGKWHLSWGSRRWTWTGCVLVSSNLGCTDECGAHMFEAPSGSSDLTFDHCSIYYRRNGSDRPIPEGGQDQGIFAQQNISGGMATVSIRNSVVAVRQTSLVAGCRQQRVVAMGTGGAAGRFDYNVYYRYGGFGDSLAVTQEYDPCSPVGPTVGAGTSCQSWFQNCHSRWAGPNASYVFTDTTWNPGSLTGPKPDLRPLPGGLIIHSTLWPDGYVGAYGPAGPTTPAILDSFTVYPQFPSALDRIPAVLTWLPPADDRGSAFVDTTLFIRMYNKPYTLVPGATAQAWWDSARVFGDYPWSYRGHYDGYIVTSSLDSLGLNSTREVGGSDDVYPNSDGAVNRTDLWFGARYVVANLASPIKFAYADLDSQITVRQSSTPPPGGINVGAASPTGTYFWWYKPQDVTSYNVRYYAGPVLITESVWDQAVQVFTGAIANDSVQPPGTIHYVRVAPPCGPIFYSLAVKATNASWTSRISGPVLFNCPGGGF